MYRLIGIGVGVYTNYIGVGGVVTCRGWMDGAVPNK
jgi:hypothetical protein